MKLEVAFVAVVAIVLVFSFLIWVGGKALKPTDGEKKITEDEDIKAPEFSSDDEAVEFISSELSEMREKIAKLRSDRNTIQNQMDMAELAKHYSPLALARLENIKLNSRTLKTAPTPEILENSHQNIINDLTWFLNQENLHPGAPWLFEYDVQRFIDLARIDYNKKVVDYGRQRVESYRMKITELASVELKDEETHDTLAIIDSLRRLVDTAGENNKETFALLNELQYEVEGLYSK